MGHKVHPYGFRIGIIKPWLAKWYADRDYAALLQEDMRIRQLVSRQLANASVSQVEIERYTNQIIVTVHSAKPGIVIGKGGQNVELLRTSLGKLTNKKVKLDIKEILQPELDGVLVAQNVAGQLERRIAFRKAMKQAIQRTIKAGAKGVKVQVSGRLGGAEMSRTEWDREGRIPLGTLRADISYGVVHAHTTYGRIGVKAWVYRGEQLGERPGSARTEPREPRRPARAAAGRSRAASGRAAAVAEAPEELEETAPLPAVEEVTPVSEVASAIPPAEEPAPTPAEEPAPAAARESGPTPAEEAAPAQAAEAPKPRASRSRAARTAAAKAAPDAEASNAPKSAAKTSKRAASAKESTKAEAPDAESPEEKS